MSSALKKTKTFHSLSLIIEKKQMRQMQEYYDRLLQKAKDELEVLRQEVNVTHQNLTITQNWSANTHTFSFKAGGGFG